MNDICDLFTHAEIERQENELFKPGQSIAEILINTTYLFDTWICASLPRMTNDQHFLRDNNLTPNERFYFFLGLASGGTLLDREFGGRPLFNIIRHAYRLRALMTRITETELIKEVWRLAKQFHDIKDEEAPLLAEAIESDPDDIPPLKYPPENDAEVVEYIQGWFYHSLGYCGEFIGTWIEFLEEQKDGT